MVSPSVSVCAVFSAPWACLARVFSQIEDPTQQEPSHSCLQFATGALEHSDPFANNFAISGQGVLQRFLRVVVHVSGVRGHLVADLRRLHSDVGRVLRIVRIHIFRGLFYLLEDRASVWNLIRFALSISLISVSSTFDPVRFIICCRLSHY